MSTIDDYWKFASMILEGGGAQRKRILAPETVTLMTTERLTASQRAASALFLGEHRGSDVGPEVPAIGILFTQRAAISPVPPPLLQVFWDGVNVAAVNLHMRAVSLLLCSSYFGHLSSKKFLNALRHVNAAAASGFCGA